MVNISNLSLAFYCNLIEDSVFSNTIKEENNKKTIQLDKSIDYVKHEENFSFSFDQSLDNKFSAIKKIENINLSDKHDDINKNYNSKDKFNTNFNKKKREKTSDFNIEKLNNQSNNQKDVSCKYSKYSKNNSIYSIKDPSLVQSYLILNSSYNFNKFTDQNVDNFISYAKKHLYDKELEKITSKNELFYSYILNNLFN